MVPMAYLDPRRATPLSGKKGQPREFENGDIYWDKQASGLLPISLYPYDPYAGIPPILKKLFACTPAT